MGGFIPLSEEAKKAIAKAREKRKSMTMEEVKAELRAERQKREKLFIKQTSKRR